MLTKTSLPSTSQAAVSFASGNEKQDFAGEWIPGAETGQQFEKCDIHPQSGGEKSVPATNGKKHDNDPSLLNISNSSHPSTVSTMSSNSAVTFVYHRRRLLKNSVAGTSALASANTKKSDCCLSTISSEAPSVETKEGTEVPVVELKNDVAIAPNKNFLDCTKGTLVAKAEHIKRCSAEEKSTFKETRNSGTANDTCSSSKSNMDLGSASLKADVDEIGECSSSDAIFIEVQDDLAEKIFCISILRSAGLLALPNQTNGHARSMGTGGGSSCSRSCKVCGKSGTTLKMLICDYCDEAFHVSCCNLRIRKVPDEWFCHSCLKKKRKMLETASNGSQNISREMGKCRSDKFKCELGHIEFMLEDTEPYITNVRIGKKDYQADVPDWSGPIINDVNTIGEPSEITSSKEAGLDRLNSIDAVRLSPIGNWVQCRAVIHGVGEGVDGTICGKWRRAPLFELQTDDWECFRTVIWDPAHADCAVPQELNTAEVEKHLKYIEVLNLRLAAKRQKLNNAKRRDGGQSSKGRKAT